MEKELQKNENQVHPGEEVKIAEGVYFTDFRQKKEPSIVTTGLCEFYKK